MATTKKFQRTKEDFVCEKCGLITKGSGYTNHCPKCLWSKHVDLNPGDRQNSCQGLMEPISVTLKDGQYFITHRCQKCKLQKKNKASKKDNFDKIIELSSEHRFNTKDNNRYLKGEL